MPLWLIEPRDPLIVRDGRPFGPDPGARARSLGFPMPSTTVGALRNRAGLDDDGVFDPEQIERVKSLGVRGPLLAELGAEPSGVPLEQWFTPAPADVLLVRSQTQTTAGQATADDDDESASDDGPVRLLPLAPLKLPEDTKASPLAGDELKLVGRTTHVAGKPLAKAPQFWRWSFFEEWLAGVGELNATRDEIGLARLEQDVRMHVSIGLDTQTAIDSALFQTIGLSFTGSSGRRFALAVECAEPFEHFDGGLVPLGGERRLVTWRKSELKLPFCPEVIRAQIKATGCCRLVLLTPACFSLGYRPTWLLEATSTGLAAKLEAVAMSRPQVVSGWDIAADNGVDEHGRPRPPGKPKPTRRLAPAGSVLFLRLQAPVGDPQIDRWIDAVWMQNVSDAAQDRLDGFGLAALGVWDGKVIAMEAH